MVIYELHVGTFSESGDFAGAISRLDDLVDLGVTAIELMPVAQFPGRRNWGYDGVQLFAPAAAYGRPEDLKALVEACHERGLAVLLDVVYNHFGPEGNYLQRHRAAFLHRAASHAVGRGNQLRRRREPAGARLRDRERAVLARGVHFDGLRLDAVHAIIDDSDPDILTELAQTVRRRITDRPVHLVLENDANEARRLRRQEGRPVGYTAQWNDDLHHALHVLVTGRTGGYYSDYAEEPIAHARRARWPAVSPIRASRRLIAAANRVASRPAMLPPTAFISFLQNHDQIGNTPFGERITSRRARGAGACGGRDRAAVAANPAVVHGRGMGSSATVPVFL